MDAKITLSFDKEVIRKAKEMAKAHNISLSRLLEYMLRRATTENYRELEEFPIADWVNEVAEGKAEYLTRQKSRKQLKDEFFKSGK